MSGVFGSGAVRGCGPAGRALRRERGGHVRAIGPAVRGACSDSPSGTRVTRPHIAPVDAVRRSKPRRSSSRSTAERHTVTPHVSNAVYWGAKRSTRYLVELEGESQDEWTTTYYRAFADDPAQKRRDRRRVRVNSGPSASGRGSTPTSTSSSSRSTSSRSRTTGRTTRRAPARSVSPCRRWSTARGCAATSRSCSPICWRTRATRCAALLRAGETHGVGVKGPGPTFMSTGYLFLEDDGAHVRHRRAVRVRRRHEAHVRAGGHPDRDRHARVRRRRPDRRDHQSAERCRPAAEALYRQAKSMQLTKSRRPRSTRSSSWPTLPRRLCAPTWWTRAAIPSVRSRTGRSRSPGSSATPGGCRRRPSTARDGRGSAALARGLEPPHLSVERVALHGV